MTSEARSGCFEEFLTPWSFRMGAPPFCWRPRSASGSARPKPRMPKRTSCTATTRPARRCRIGSPTSSGAPTRSARPRPNLRRRRRLLAAAEAKLKAEDEAEAKREAEGRRKGGRQAAPPSSVPDAKAQKNFTDPQSRIMKSKDGFVQAYNAQAAVDAEAQIIVAQDVTQSAVDCGQLMPMTDAIETNLGRKPAQLSADAGYCSEANLAGLEARNIDGYVATGRARDAVAGTAKDKTPVAPPSTQLAATPTRVEAMREKIKAGGHASPYRLRKQLPEPVFGQIKQARGFRQFLLRGIEKVRAEWAIVCTAHNLLKLAPSRTLSAALPLAAAAA